MRGSLIYLIILKCIFVKSVKINLNESPSSGIVNVRTNKGPVVYPHVSKQVMTTSTSTLSSVPNTTIVYQKGFIPIPGVMTTSATSTETTTAIQSNQERRNGFSTASQEVDNQIPSTPGIKVDSYDPLVTPISGEARYPTYEHHFPSAVTSRPYTFEHIPPIQNSVYQPHASFEENDISSHLLPELEHATDIENNKFNFHQHLQHMHQQQQQLQHEEKHENHDSFFGTMMGILGALIPLGVLISALNPNYVVINPNATVV